MPEQLLLQGKLLGAEDFLAREDAGDVEAGALWLALVCEVVPRALLAELELARVLLGSSGGGQFLLVLPDNVRERAHAFLTDAARRIHELTGASVRLIWAVTENLGDWTVVRKRLNEEMAAHENAPLANARSFEPFTAGTDNFFTPELARELRETELAGWSPELPGIFSTKPEKHTWSVGPNLSLDGILLTRSQPARPRDYMARSSGRPMWGVLRGDVDHFAVRLRRLTSIEEYVQLSVLYKHFFAGELNAPNRPNEFHEKFAILYSGGDDFAVWGSWDALIDLARELHGTFQRFSEENLRDFPGPEAKTITMAIALSENPDEPLSRVFEQAGKNLQIAKDADKDCIFLLDRVLEWKQLADAAELKDAVSRVSEDFRAGRGFLEQLTALYAKVSSSQADHERLVRRAYRFQRKYSRTAGSKREREFTKLRTHLINEIVGRNVRPGPGKQFRLRPAGVVALEWARLLKESAPVPEEV